jgi:hypothetical protein
MGWPPRASIERIDRILLFMGPVSLLADVNRCLTLPTLLQWLAQERNWVRTRGLVAGMLGIVSGALFLRSNGPAQLY